MQVGVTLTLYTRSGPPGGEALDFREVKKVGVTHFDPASHTKVIVHGYMDNGSEDWIVRMREEFLRMDNFNVIVVAWGPGARALYPKSVANTRVIGAVTAHFLTSLKEEYNVSMSRVHLLGHSLGAHVAGYVGSSVGGIARISGMDPAGPLFESTDAAVRIDPSDADFVDCIHTDGLPLKDLGFGTMSAWCDADFYPNGGKLQPGCPKAASHLVSDVFSWRVLDAEDAVSCSHSRSHDLYINSIQRCSFPSTPCDTYQRFQAGQCQTCATPGDCVSMGYHAADSKPLPRGKYFLSTAGSAPYC
ncbi:inactive pancreatic lipase-related protein 1-like [Babylonia areolata]|uniref:inactive pancreatic lipase-related protein 1-like n=1 Tax=Babylonia areolata TaxID=304850 RepID=UPI003FD0B5B0